MNVHYDDIKHQIKPFDLIAFRGGDLASDLIDYLQKKMLFNGDFTHVGIIVTSDILTNYKDYYLEDDELYLLESTFSFCQSITHSTNDVISNHGRFGVQLKKLKDVVSTYLYNDKTKIAWCQLQNNPFDDNHKLKLKEDFTQFFNDYYVRHYDMDPLSLLGAMFPQLRGLRDCKDKMINKIWLKLNKQTNPALWQFCSELVANVYQLIGVIPKDVDCKNVVPMDFFGYDKDGLEAIVNKPIYFIK